MTQGVSKFLLKYEIVTKDNILCGLHVYFFVGKYR